MICLSYGGSIKQMKRLVQQYDQTVLSWSEKLVDTIQVTLNNIVVLNNWCYSYLLAILILQICALNISGPDSWKD